MTERSFIKAARKAADKPVDEPIVFDLTTYEEDEEGELLENGHGGPLIDPEDGHQIRGFIIKQTVLHASRPDDDAMIVSFAAAGRADASTADRVSVIFDAFKDMLPASESRQLIARVKDRNDEVTIEMLTEIYEWLQEQWTDFPTQSSSDSSRRRSTGGRNSTGRSPSDRSTRSSKG